MSKKIVMFTSNTCVNCKLAKDFLKEKGLEWEEKNVSTDIAAKKELMANGYMGVPVIFVENEVVVGFNRDKLEEVLSK